MIIAVPLYIALFAYLFFLLGFFIFAFVNVGHLVHTGTITFTSLLVTLSFLVFTSLILWYTWFLLREVNWQQPVILWNSAWLNNVLPVENL